MSLEPAQLERRTVIVDAHTPRFEEESPFFFALLGVVSVARRLDPWLRACLPPSSSARQGAAQQPPSPFDYALLGAWSYRRQVLEHVEALSRDARVAGADGTAAAQVASEALEATSGRELLR